MHNQAKFSIFTSEILRKQNKLEARAQELNIT